MAYESSEIIVLRVVNYSESSQIIDAVSPEFGKLGLIAKGIRKLPKNSVGAAFDLLCHAKIDFRSISTEGLEAVSENIVVSYFPALRKSLRTWFAGILITEKAESIAGVPIDIYQMDADTYKKYEAFGYPLAASEIRKLQLSSDSRFRELKNILSSSGIGVEQEIIPV